MSLIPTHTDPILVTGGTGLVGSYFLRKLLLEGYTDVHATKRPTSDMSLVSKITDQIKWHDVDVLNMADLDALIASVDYVVHAAAKVSYDPKDKKAIHEVNVIGTSNVVNSCLANNIKKLLHVSSIAAIGRSDKQLNVSENTPWTDSDITSAYSRSKHLSEMEVWRGNAEGLPVAIINPTLVLGSGRWGESSTQVFMQLWKGLKFYPTGSTGWVDVRDVATMMHKMLDSEVVGERFICNGENISYQKLFMLIANELGKPVPTIKATNLMKKIAWLGDSVWSKITGSSPFITKETIKISGKSFSFNNQKSKDTFGMEYTAILRTVRETSKQLIEASKNDFKAMSLDFPVSI